MSKARNLADLLDANGDVKADGLDNVPPFENIVDTGTEGTKIAAGTTAQRGNTAGQLRFNSTTGLAEYYTGSAFKSIDAPPTISSVGNGNISEEDIASGYTLSITGSGFNAGATVKFIGADNTEYTSASVTVNSDTSISATVPSGVSNANEPYSVKVTNISGLSNTLTDAFNVNASPAWTTATGNLSDNADDASLSITVSASDPEGAAITYAVESGSSLPTGLSLNSSTGVISGTAPDVTAATTSSFNLEASDGSNTVSRSFNIITRPTLNTKSGYPLSGSNYQVFTGNWSNSNVQYVTDLSHAATTFTVPANVYAIRVVCIGSGATFRNGYSGGSGGVSDVILRVEPNWKFKAIAATMNYFSGADNGNNGANGLGGGCAQDSNDNGVGGAGSGFFYAGTGTTPVSSANTMFANGVVIAGGGGCAGGSISGGHGNGGGTGSFSLNGQTVYGVSGGNGSGASNSNGGIYTGQGGHMISSNGSIAVTGPTIGNAAGYANEGYSGSYVAGAGGAAGGGGAGGGDNSRRSPEANGGSGGRGSSNYDGTLNTAGAGLGGVYSAGVSMGGNGFIFNGISLGGGGAGGHGASQGGGGWSGGGSGYYSMGGGGGSGIICGDLLDSAYFNTLANVDLGNGLTGNGGTLSAITGAATNLGSRYNNRTSGGTGPHGAVIVIW